MTPDELRARLMTFATDVASFAKLLFDHAASRSAADQLMRAAASAAANHRAAGEARSDAEFIAKVGLALEEADESLYWLEWLKRMRFGDASRLETLLKEAIELTKILGASKRTAKRNRERKIQEQRACAAGKSKRDDTT